MVVAVAIVSLVAAIGCRGSSCGASTSQDSASADEQADAGGAPTTPRMREVDEPLEAARAFYETRPYYQSPFEHTEVPEGLPDMSAETCGDCHQAIYEEWKVSTHARAWTDPQFQAELKKSSGHRSRENEENSADDVGWMCVNCHAPLKNQLERLVVDLEDDNIGKPVYTENPSFDEELQHEGITCASCHVRDGKVYGPWGDTDAPHPTAKDPELLTERVCTQCHQAEARFPSRNLACFFTTGQEWEGSEYGERDEYCQTCHMPSVERRLVADKSSPKRQTRRHWFGGSLIAKRPKHRDELEPLRKIYGSGAKIEVLGADEAPDPATRAEDGVMKSGDCPEGAGECVELWVRVTNAYAGHRFPTGDPERHIDIEATATADTGNENGDDSGDGEVVARAEQRVASKYKWWPDIVLQYDNRIDPGEALSFPLAVPTSELPATVELEGDKYRMYTDAYEHHDLEGRYVRGRHFHSSRWRIDADGRVDLEEIDDDWGARETLLPEKKRKPDEE